MHRNFSQVPLRLKIIMVGDSGVGKTNIKDRFCRNTFKVQSNPTVGIQYANRKFWASWNGKKQKFEVNFWDVSGAQNQSMITPLYFKNAIGVVYVYDVTKQQSLQSLIKWRDIVKRHSNCSQIVQLVIGNKTDLAKLRQVNLKKAQSLANELGINLIFQTSALKQTGINDSLYYFIGAVIKQMQVKGVKIPLKQQKIEKSHRGCC